MVDGIQYKRDEYFENLKDSVFSELEKHAEPEPIVHNDVMLVSVEQAYKELLKLKKEKL